MTTVLNKHVDREIITVDGMGRLRCLIVRMAREGLYMKGKGQRWSSALLLPWSSAHLKAAWLEAERLKREKRERKKAKKADGGK